MNTTNRQIALATGVNRYVGRPCKYGHAGLRRTSDGNCIDCARKKKPKRTPAYRAMRQRAKKRYLQKMRAERPEQWKSLRRKQALARRAKEKAGLKKRRVNRDTKARQRKERKLTQRNRVPQWAKTPEHRAAVAAVYRKRRELTEATGVLYEVDHFYPLRGATVSGLHVVENLRVIPAHTNWQKGARHPADFLMS